MTVLNRIQKLSLNEFVNEIRLNIPDENSLTPIFGKWMSEENIKNYLSEGGSYVRLTNCSLDEFVEEIAKGCNSYIAFIFGAWRDKNQLREFLAGKEDFNNVC